MDTINIAVPTPVENMSLPDPFLRTFYTNLEERALWFDSDVTNESLEFERYIIEYNRQDKGVPITDRKPIKIMFFSPGGDLDVNNALIDIIRLSKTPVWGFNVGTADSAAAFIFLACHKRFSLPNAVFLLHKGSGTFSGSYDEVIAHIENYQRQITELANYVLSTTNIPEDILEENLCGEWYIPAEQALEYGIVDEIVYDIDVLL